MREIPDPLGRPVPPGLWAIIQRCLIKEPIQRYQRAGEVQAALEAVQSGAIVSAPSADLSPPRTTVLHSVQHAHVRKGDFLLLVGTTKGAFILRSNAQRSRWEVGGPCFPGHSVYALAYDATANTAYGLQRKVIGALYCDPATISGRAGPIRSRHPFDFPPIPAFP